MIADTSVVINSTIQDDIKVYQNSELKNSSAGIKTIIGSDTIVQFSNLESNISINRRNFIHRSNIGRFSYTGINTQIRSTTIGRFCSISYNVSIGGGDHPKDYLTNSTLQRFFMLYDSPNNQEAKNNLNQIYANQDNCIINNDVLISTNAVILRDLEIGNGAVIGAGAVVTKDVEPYSIVVGVPAKKIKMRFSDKIIEALEEIKWWDWPVEIIKNNLELIYSTKVDESVIDKLREIGESIK